MLEECIASVTAQTYPDHEHLIGVDEERQGCSFVMNQLAEQAVGEWLLPLADDDLILPGCLATLLASSAEADIVYAPPLVWGNGSKHFFGTPPYIPSFALIRSELWRTLGGYAPGLVREEDRDLWVRAIAAGARFVRADSAPTWIYRFHAGNKSYHRGVAS
jgi:glycosyltransferase involved in cell wall biosynthesis